jgi:hypothetical protein
MAKTFPTERLEVNPLDDTFLSYTTKRYLEAASQTYPAGSPVKNSSGYIAEWENVADADIIGFVFTAGSNDGSAGLSTVDVVLAVPDLRVEANFLGAAAADNVLAQADLFIERDLLKGANLLGTGAAGWYIADAADGAAVIIQEFDCFRVKFADRDNYKPEAGDTNARVRAAVKPGVSAWY